MTFCEITWNLSNASLVVSEGSDIVVARRSVVIGEDNGWEEDPGS